MQWIVNRRVISASDTLPEHVAVRRLSFVLLHIDTASFTAANPRGVDCPRNITLNAHLILVDHMHAIRRIQHDVYLHILSSSAVCLHEF